MSSPTLDALGSPTLTPRQASVLALIFEGLTAAEIADRLGLKKQWVTSVTTALLETFHANNRCHLVYKALLAGALEVPGREVRRPSESLAAQKEKEYAAARQPAYQIWALAGQYNFRVERGLTQSLLIQDDTRLIIGVAQGNLLAGLIEKPALSHADASAVACGNNGNMTLHQMTNMVMGLNRRLEEIKSSHFIVMAADGCRLLPRGSR